MLIDTHEYIHKVNGIPLFYGPLHYSPYATPPYDLFMTSKITPPESLSPITLTPPLSPHIVTSDQSRRSSVIMKVENCQVVPARSDSPVIKIDHVCRWENCYRYFESLEKLANHVSVMHSSSGVDNFYYCKWEGCSRMDRGFNARYKMLVHSRVHTGEKPHKCTFPECGKSFSRAENLKIHIRSHTFEKPYRCNFPGCTKAYSNSSDRFKHRRTHQTCKPYCCKVIGCEKSYTDPSSLRKHVKTFNHESLMQQKPFEAKRNESSEKTDKQYFSQVISEHLERDKICYYDTWTDNSEISNQMGTISLNEPLDLSLRGNR